MLFAGRKDITGMRWLTKTGVVAQNPVVSASMAIFQQYPVELASSHEASL
jgi:hypothetical protein